MAMRSGAVAMPEKVSMQWYGQHHQMDEREGFLMWLRGEFAAANAMIDALCHHLRAVGEPGEYDGVIGSIQLRRCNWNPILHMQQYFSVAEVEFALQQVSWRRQHRSVGFDGSARMGGGGKEFRREGRGQRGGVDVQNLGGEGYGKDVNDEQLKANLNANDKLIGVEKDETEENEEKKEVTKKSEADGSAARLGAVNHADNKQESAGCCNVDGSGLVLEVKQSQEVSPKTFVATEICDGKSINIAEGLKLYKDQFIDSEIVKLITLVNDLRAAGRKGQLPGQTFVVSKRPMKGHGREMIQLGVPIIDAPPEEEAVSGTSKDLNVEPIPAVMQDIVERLFTENVLSIKPDSCIIDVFNEGDHSQPHIWPQWFGRPVCVLFLTECEMSFGKMITVDNPGDYRGALRLSLLSGSVLVIEGRSADYARHAIPSLRKQRILVTLVKSQPRKINASDGNRLPSVGAHPSSWAPPPSQSPSHVRPVTTKHLGPIPPIGVLSAPTACPQLSQPNGIQPIFVPAPVGQAVAFATPVCLPPASAGWPAAAPIHPPPRLLLPGTGVFLPSKNSSNSSSPPPTTSTSENANVETSAMPEDHGLGNHTSAPQESNTGTPENNVVNALTKEEEHEDHASAK